MTWLNRLTFFAICLLGSLVDAQRVFAWGPGVHTVMAIHVLNDVSLLLPTVARAVSAFPWEYLYGCLAADFFIGKTRRTRSAGAHNWEGGSRLLRGAADDREAAYAYGFLSHLAADVVAHNFFIPNIIRRHASSRGMGHLFWEMKADYLSGPDYTKLARAALSMEHPECDELLQAVTGRARNGLKAKKRLFTQSVKFSDYVYDKHDAAAGCHAPRAPVGRAVHRIHDGTVLAGGNGSHGEPGVGRLPDLRPPGKTPGPIQDRQRHSRGAPEEPPHGCGVRIRDPKTPVMNLIRILPEKVASQIAAGEIIERPASVARELLDNSIDAGADQIEVRIEGGGRRLIRVRDNGAGMSRDDLLLSVERHATSKIREISDLSRILSLGFRGEALPSIAAVSRLEIVARPRDEVTAHRLRIAGGKFLSMEEAGAPAGTIVEVRDLFYNLPARRKFLGGVKLEGDHVADVVTRMGLPHTGVAFRLQQGDKAVLSYGALEDPRARLGQVLGRKTAAELLEIREEQAGVGVHAFLAPPEFSRSRGDRLLFFVNRRNVRDRMMARAVMEGFGQRLMRGRYPQVAVFLSLDPSAVDVNVHPTKQEVRFQDGRRVFRLLSAAIDKALRPAVPSPSRRDPVAVPAPVQERLQVAEPSWEYESETRANAAIAAARGRRPGDPFAEDPGPARPDLHPLRG